MTWVAGVDGCPGGWVAVFGPRDGTSDTIRARVLPSLAAICDAPEAPAIVAVDIPIGLPDRVGPGGRAAEVLVRALLGPRRASVFPTSARSVVYAPDYTSAIALSRRPETQPFAPSPPANAIFPRIREADGLLRARPELQDRVYEVHPELAFLCLNGGAALPEPKRKPAGLALRRGLLARAGLPADLAPPRGAKPDDLLDALAALAVARAIANGRGVPYPDPPERDAHGLPAAIWTLPHSEAPA
jgi:predicted RNase H-like nuclease